MLESDNPDNVSVDVSQYCDQNARVRSGASGKDWGYKFVPLKSTRSYAAARNKGQDFSVGSIWVDTTNSRIPRKHEHLGAIQINVNQEIRVIFKTWNLTKTALPGGNLVEQNDVEVASRIQRGSLIPYEFFVKEWVVLESDYVNHETLAQLSWQDALPYIQPFITKSPALMAYGKYRDRKVQLASKGTIVISTPQGEISVRIKTPKIKYLLMHPVCVSCGAKAEIVRILRPVHDSHAPNRLALFTRDGHQLTIDHTMPKALGGESSIMSGNAQTMCDKCNFTKGHTHPEEWKPRMVQQANL